MSFDLDIPLQRSGDPPLYEQLREHLARAILGGRLVAGARLPSTREVSTRLEVNRATAVEAYRRLEHAGLVERRKGSGTFVREVPALDSGGASGPARVRGSAGLRALEATGTKTDVSAAPADSVDLAAISPDEEGYPAIELAECLQRVLTERGASALGYGPPAGDMRLREVLVSWLARRGLHVAVENVLVVGGAQQGLDLVLRALVDPGDSIVTESPTYHHALDLCRFHQLDVIGVSLRATPVPGIGALDLDRLADAISRRRPTLVYLMPNFQNPTGLTLDLATRRRVLELCAAAGTVLLEDDYEADMRHGGEPVPPMASLSHGVPTIYVGTLSKALFPGLRVGWVVAPSEILSRLARVKRASDLCGPAILQAAAAELIASGAYERHLGAVIAQARARVTALRQALAERLPDGCATTSPLGGHALWLELPEGVDAAAACRRATARGVLVTAGEAFRPGQGSAAVIGEGERDGLRLSVARLPLSAVPRVAEGMASAVLELMQERAPRHGHARASMDVPVHT